MENRWINDNASGDALDQLVYLSRIMGQDENLVVWGGGNTSIKIEGVDLLGRQIPLMLIKGTGSDMKAAERKDFPAVRLAEVRASMQREHMTDGEMVAYLARCMMDPAAPRPSIETMLHAFIESTAVAHSHADAILSLTNTRGGEETVTEALGLQVAIVPYQRPGFALAREVAAAVRNHPQARAVVLMNHGLITWGDTAQESYDRHIDVVAQAEAFIARRSAGRDIFAPRVDRPAATAEERCDVAAQLAPVIRRLLSESGSRKILRFDDSPDVLNFIASARLDRLTEVGPATPDHILNIKRHPLVVASESPLNGQALARAAETAMRAYRERYLAHYTKFRTDEPLLEPSPRVVLVPGVGMWTTGKDVRACTIPRDIYHHTIHVIEGAEGVDSYASLDDRDAFEAEYWPLELYKLTLAPKDRELAGRAALITGAAGEIGAAIARRLASEGAHVLLTDLNLEGAEQIAAEVSAAYGSERAIAARLDVTNEASVADAFRKAQLEFGGLDILVSNAGFATVSPLAELSLEAWERSLAVNATGHFLVGRQGLRLLKHQGLGGSIVFVATKNVTAPGRDFGAYSAAKAAEAQLARVMAIEGGSDGVRVNMVNPDAVFGGSGLWSAATRQQRAASYGIAPEQLEDYYQQRNLLKLPITADDVAEAVFWLACDRSAKTTGAMIPVDGGVREAFAR